MVVKSHGASVWLQCLLAAVASDNHLTLAIFHRQQQVTFIALGSLLHASESNAYLS